MKGVMRSGMKIKLSPRFIGPFEILSRVREVAYELVLPSIILDKNLSYKEEPIAILDREVRKLWFKKITSVKVRWKNRSVGEATWENESNMHNNYPQVFTESGPQIDVGILGEKPELTGRM
ncbi:uncharacterized protein LOC132639332 [Lycium barbarum]|uniref:uncharacterized protein LOC132639332 n=1 Tax=Lycium barbarum TaxID=112863 RepID=UPI00293E69D7|nr:uncharacterized protein LOC132639332 [Lycium barbarum]